ncbi:protein PAT1 homolog 2 isoform X3 [Anolis carolinensis]|uniref:protein PAT1 homolog 2 isoform X3 n=1 Tax=Anolis carolinensis TaxID=28377 RepID=UPI002F2B1E55
MKPFSFFLTGTFVNNIGILALMKVKQPLPRLQETGLKEWEWRQKDKREGRGERGVMAEGGQVEAAVILEDFFMMEEELVADETTEEGEIDLYVNLTFTSAAFVEENGAKGPLTDLEQAPKDEPEEAMLSAAGKEQPSVVEEEESKAIDTDPMIEDNVAEPMVEDNIADNGSFQPEPQPACDAMEEEEAAVAEKEEGHTNGATGEPNDLGDPAVMKAVRGQSALEAIERASLSRADLDFLASPVQKAFLDSLGLEHSVFHGRTIKPSSPHFMRQSPVKPGSVRSPYLFTPPRRTRRAFGLNQRPGYASPPPFRPFFPSANSPTWSLSHIPDVPPFSPSIGSQQKFSFPSAMTQLHPLHQRILTQRQNRGHKRMPCREPRPPMKDPYASLMTAEEKDWVIKVQMLQLQSENPQRNDYYYQGYYHKLEQKQAEKGPFGGSKPEIPKLVTPYIQKVETYESVVRIPGSLGQVAVSTCYSPRRAIDAVHHISLEQAIGNQRLHVLYQIEKMYLELLAAEDMQQKLELAPEEQRSHFCEKLAHQVEHMYQSLRIEEPNSEEEAKDEFLQILLVGKGKRLVARLLPHLSQEQAKRVLVAVAQHLPLLIKKDVQDETLPILYSPLRIVIEHLAFSELIDILQDLIKLHPEPVKQPLALVFGNKFAISFLYLLLSHGERCLSSGIPENTNDADFEKWVNTVLLVARELSHVPKASMVEPLHLPSNLLLLFCRYVDKDIVTCLDDKME